MNTSMVDPMEEALAAAMPQPALSFLVPIGEDSGSLGHHSGSRAAVARLHDVRERRVAVEVSSLLAVADLSMQLELVMDDCEQYWEDLFDDPGSRLVRPIGIVLAAEEIATAWGIPTDVAGNWLRQVMFLYRRMPCTWSAAVTGAIREWTVREVADVVYRSGLSADKVAIVDEELAGILPGLTHQRSLNVAYGYIVAADPDRAAEREARLRRGRQVRLSSASRGDPATRVLWAAMRSSDACLLYAAARQVAELLPPGVGANADERTALALGILATPARVLALLQSSLQPELVAAETDLPTAALSVERDLATATLSPAPDLTTTRLGAEPELASIASSAGMDVRVLATSADRDFATSAPIAEPRPPSLGATTNLQQLADLSQDPPPRPHGWWLVEPPEHWSPEPPARWRSAWDEEEQAKHATWWLLDPPDEPDVVPPGADPRSPAGCRGHTCGSVSVPPHKLAPRADLVVHISAETAERGSGVARLEGHGPLSLTGLRELFEGWQLRVRPVVDLNQLPAVDRYEVPDLHRFAVQQRDPYDVFPWSNRRAASLDLNHVQPYRSGRPGQTRVGNLVPLTRTNHRATTGRHAWRVTRTADGFCEWTSPFGYTYATGPTGTLRRALAA
ncbi:MAG TPA: hypothetical protein PKM36_00910 [Propionibacteriaceae bacterium]|nr:hypothetical protein [Propionibacteriaceae bacterium]